MSDSGIDELRSRTLAVEESLFILSAQNQELLDKLAEKQLQLNLTQQDLDGARSELQVIQKDSEDKSLLKRSYLQVKQMLAESVVTKERDALARDLHKEREANFQGTNKIDELSQYLADKEREARQIKENLAIQEELKTNYEVCKKELDEVNKELERERKEAKNEQKLAQEEKIAMMEVHRSQLYEAQKQLEELKLHNKQVKQQFAVEHNSIVTEIVKEKEDFFKMEELLQNERETHSRLMKSMESNLESKTRQINKMITELDEHRKELKATRMKVEDISHQNEELEREREKWKLKYSQIVKESENRKLLDKDASPGGIAMLKERAQQSVMWESEANLWKSKFQELQQTLSTFNFEVEKVTEITVFPEADSIIEKLREQHEQKCRDVESLKKSVHELQDENMIWHQKYSEINATNTFLETTLQNERTSTRKEKETYENNGTLFREKSERLQLELSRLKDENLELCERMQQLKITLNPEERSQQVLRSLKALQDKIHELAQEKAEHQLTKSKLEEITKMYSSLQDLLNEKTSIITKLREQKKQLHTKLHGTENGSPNLSPRLGFT